MAWQVLCTKMHGHGGSVPEGLIAFRIKSQRWQSGAGSQDRFDKTLLFEPRARNRMK
jgi:hypothetical protein